MEVPVEELVVGDVVVLEIGDVVPADLRLLSSVELKVNEMLLTGESRDVSKESSTGGEVLSISCSPLTPSNMLFSSTTLSSGHARGVVVETGLSTRVGSIALLLQDSSSSSSNPLSRGLARHRPKLTPLQLSLHQLGIWMGVAALCICGVVFAVGMLRQLQDPKHPERPVWLTMLMLSVSMAISAVPEGLPMVVTICLSSGTAKMVAKCVLVRKLAAVETLGAASVICTDKTGTLTEGKMRAVKLWASFVQYEVTGTGFCPIGEIIGEGGEEGARKKRGEEEVSVRGLLLVGGILCCNTQLQWKEDEQQWISLGNSTEAPLVVAAAKLGLHPNDFYTKYPRVGELPFSSERKMMITLHSLPPSASSFEGLLFPAGTRYVACAKGAPNVLLELCVGILTPDGRRAELTLSQHTQVSRIVDDFSSQALRVLGVAYLFLTELPETSALPFFCKLEELVGGPTRGDLEAEEEERWGWVLAGLVASVDPERGGVREAIATSRAAGVRTVMITGDYLNTAVAIARNIDLLQLGCDVEEESTDCGKLRPLGETLYLPHHDLDDLVARTSVFARALPRDKLEIVRSLQRQGFVVAMTGDGVNDAPALKEADIGVAMGRSGTEVAKGAADMLLTDDNFCSIVGAVEQGRVIYANIQKFVTFLLSTNLGEILLILSSIAGGLPIPLEALQILLLNLFTDGMPAVALSLEAGDPSIMRERPRPRSQHILHGRMWFFMAFNALLLACSAMGVYLLGLYWNFGVFTLDAILETTRPAVSSVYPDPYLNATCSRYGGPGQGWLSWGACGTNLTLSPAACVPTSYDCVADGLARAQTMTFVCITFTEVFRAYTVRSFTQVVFVGMFDNSWMQGAALASLTLTLLVTNVPIVMDNIFGFQYIDWYMWLVALAAAFNTVFWGEMLKWVIRRRERDQGRWRSMADGFEAVLLEIRNLRHHVGHLEEKLEVAQRRPVKRLHFMTPTTHNPLIQSPK
jgi:potassium/sodium efflux P-type ATPase